MSVATVSLSSVFGSKLPSIYETTFAKTDKTDAILVVGGKKLHVNRTLLSCHSDYFNTLFNSDSKEKSQEEIEIKDVKFEDFATLLSLVHPNPIKVGAENAEKILALADRFRFPLAKNHLEHVLMLSTISDKVDKMRIGDERQTGNPTTRCIFWPKCTKREACQFVHPTTACNNFPNCAFGQRCLFIHPNCRFDRFCVNKHCQFTHLGTGGSRNPLISNRFSEHTQPSSHRPSARGARGKPAEKLLAVSIKKKNKKPVEGATSDKKKKGKNEVSRSGKEFPNVAPLQNPTPCRYAGGCRNPVCPFKHPKECRFGANCRNPSCHFYHKPSATPADAKYKWTAASTASTAN